MAIDEATARASLASVPGVNTNDYTAFRLGFVSQEGAQLSECPAVQPTVLLAATLLGPGADVCQVFNGNGSPWGNGVNDLPTELVVQVAPKPKLFTRETAKMFLRALGAFGLQGTTKPKVSILKFTPAALAEEAIVGSDGRTTKAKVNADDSAIINELYVGQSNHDVQPETALAFDKVGTIKACGSIKRRLKEGGYSDRQDKTTGDSGQADGVVVGEYPVATSIVPDRRKLRVGIRDLATLFLKGKGRLDGLGSSHPGGTNKLSWQSGMLGSQRIIGRFMQFHAVLLAVLPTVITNGIETGRVLSDGFRENSRLCFCWVEKQSYCALHSLSVSYVARICKKKEGGLRRALFLPALKRRGFHSAYVL